jgi:hypothetical protein
MENNFFSLSKNAKLAGTPANCEEKNFDVGLIWNVAREDSTFYWTFRDVVLAPCAGQLRMLSRNAHSRTMFISFVGRTPVAIPPEPLP